MFSSTFPQEAYELIIPDPVPPTIEAVAPTANQIIGGAPFIPAVRVADGNGDTLNVNYYLDSESSPRETLSITNTTTAQLVSFNALNVGQLYEGGHTIRFTVSDGKATTEQTVGFTVDHSGPNLQAVEFSSTDTSIQITGSANDPVGGLDAAPYRYTVGPEVSPWTQSTSYAKAYLTPNTAYYTKFEARDAFGQISAREQTTYTKAQRPGLTANSVTTTSAGLSLNDGNPSGTRYQITTNGLYVNNAGQMSGTPEWIAPVGKSVMVTGLMPNTAYTFQAQAINEAGAVTGFGTAMTAVTLPTPPVNITTEISQQTIKLAWPASPGVSGYDVEADGIVKDNGTLTSFTDSGLVPNSQHTYRVRARNAGGTSVWSEYITKQTLPDPPPTPGNVEVTTTQTVITITWDLAVRATGYDIEVDGEVVDVKASKSYVHSGLLPETEHTYRVRAKNSGGASEWSPIVKQKTWPNPPPAVTKISSQPSIHKITLNWEPVERATGYEVEADGYIRENGNSTQFVDEGLDALTDHTYRIRAKNIGGKGPWSEPQNVRTHPEKPITPGNVMGTSEETAITLMWYQVPHADSYDVEVDGTTILNVQGNQLVDPNLSPDSKHSYRVRAKNISGDSEWTRPITLMTLPAGSGKNLSLTNMVAVVAPRSIMISWETVAPDAQYDIEVDGELQDNGKNTIYNHTGLNPNEFHTYKIRLRNGQSGEWVAILSLSTLPDLPDAPTGLNAFATTNTIELNWNKVAAADGYDIEVDGTTVDIGANTNYLHTKLAPGTSHTYRVRAKNITGAAAWSEAITKSTTSPAYTVNAHNGMQFDLILFAYNVQDFNESQFVVTYDQNQLEIVDLYNFTPALDTKSGKIPGSNLEVTYAAGKIVFRNKLNIVPGTSWSGEITTLKFKSKFDGQASIEVTAQ
ncbi:fibronectin type III domain-containing protein [Paenibacillus hamazuiensis]|uniref:fibronectin type III domain-containing protein n=1 Tax=Paenibacillus hamazuiensis TaxID=2936508 RepID=UPI00200BA16B|nr:hypothetical protein [Paenibacillus hamazuiensis]